MGEVHGAALGNPEATFVNTAGDVAAVARELCEIDRKTGLARAAGIGKLVLDRFFGGSVEEWRRRKKNKNNSVRRLAEHPDCPLSRSALNRALAIFVALREIGEEDQLRHIRATHVAAVSHLGSAEQRNWLIKANSERWSVRTLSQHLTEARRESGERRGRPKVENQDGPMQNLRQAVIQLERTVGSFAAIQPPAERPQLTLLAERVRIAASELQRLIRRVEVADSPASVVDASPIKEELKYAG